MSTNRSTLLSVALTPTSADIAEVRREGKGAKVLRRSTLIFAQDAGLDQPAKLGAALAEHLEATGYTSRQAVVGLCPRWVLARLKQVPPADPEAIRGIVNLQIEREFAGSASEMAFDYILDDTPQGTSDVSLLLAGVRQSILSQTQQVFQSAGLRIESITPTAIAAARNQSGTVVLIEDGVAGVMSVRDGHVAALASCQADVGSLHDRAARARLLADLSRCVMQQPCGVSGNALTLILPSTLAEHIIEHLLTEAKERFGAVQLLQADAASLLAEHAMSSGDSLIRFNQSRLAAPKRRKISPRMQWALRAAVLVLLIGGTGLYLWHDVTSKRDALQAELDAISDTAEQLGKTHRDTMLAAQWYDDRPPALDCMLELTRTFPKQGEIRVETLTLRGEMVGQIDCAAKDRETMDTYFTQMQQSDSLLKINRGPVRPSGGNSSWIDFSVAFEFDPKAEGATP